MRGRSPQFPPPGTGPLRGLTKRDGCLAFTLHTCDSCEHAIVLQSKDHDLSKISESRKGQRKVSHEDLHSYLCCGVRNIWKDLGQFTVSQGR